MPEIQKVNDTTFEAVLPCGEKVEIGDRKSVDFKPYLKLNRWDGECFIKVGLSVTEKSLPIIEGDKIIWEGRNRHILMYPFLPSEQFELGAYEYEVVLNKKPKTNKFALNIQNQGLKFFYQPALTPPEIEGGCFRPDNIVGSYAVYHATKGGMVDSRGKDYKTGIAFHIPRPKIFDARGDWVWGELYYDEIKGLLITTIPQEFLEYAHYPISHAAGDTFGYTTKGGSYYYMMIKDCIRAIVDAPSAGTGTSISYYLWYYTGSEPYVKFALYKDSDDSFIKGTDQWKVTVGWNDWKTLNFTTSPTLEAINYKICAWGEDNVYGYYDVVTDAGRYQGLSYNGWPSTADFLTDNTKHSIYCTYTPAPVVAPTVTTQDATGIGFD